ncbi:hypothetical protein [Nonomuraea fuscirosea]|uniref:hypothetical protein n=1 Tax=Nonomuraea fuscirosea TaxID=1291556 RepID=UPI0033D71794
MNPRLPMHYQEAVNDLTADTIVKKLAANMLDKPDEEFVDADGNLRYDFMRASAEEYLRAGGQHRGPVGAVGHAMLRLRANTPPAEALTPAVAEPVEAPQEAAAQLGDPVPAPAPAAVGDPSTCVHGQDCQHQRCERYGCEESDCCR